MYSRVVFFDEDDQKVEKLIYDEIIISLIYDQPCHSKFPVMTRIPILVI